MTAAGWALVVSSWIAFCVGAGIIEVTAKRRDSSGPLYLSAFVAHLVLLSIGFSLIFDSTEEGVAAALGNILLSITVLIPVFRKDD